MNVLVHNLMTSLKENIVNKYIHLIRMQNDASP